eukprot:jgi/Mesen1/4801/ME000243S03977
MVVISETEAFDSYTFLVTGGAGYVGRRLCLELALRGAKEVRCFDLSFRRTEELQACQVIRFIQGDVRDPAAMSAALQGVDCVCHLASFGMSGKDMLQRSRVEAVNVGGTRNVLTHCQLRGVSRLVYTSTYNVVFGGQPIDDGDESLEYLPPGAHLDPYGRSKAAAEQLVLQHDNSPLASGGRLFTCALRPAAIYGPEEERHFPRIMTHVRRGLFLFTIGDKDARVDWVHVDNLVHAHLLATAALLAPPPDEDERAAAAAVDGEAQACAPGAGSTADASEAGADVCGAQRQAAASARQPIAAGQAYFISDDAPVNNFEFLRPIVEGQGYAFPAAGRRVSVAAMMRVARVVQACYASWLLSPLLHFAWLPDPLILPAEVVKVGVNHHFSVAKARQQLGYEPIVEPREGMRQMVAYWRNRRWREMDHPGLLAWALIPAAMWLLLLAAYLPPPYMGPLECVRTLGVYLFLSREGLAMVWWLAVGAHIVEAAFAYVIASSTEPENALKWALQTALLGYWSLRLLLRRAPERGLLDKLMDQKED